MNEATQTLSEEEKESHMDMLNKILSTKEKNFDKTGLMEMGALLSMVSEPVEIKGHWAEFCRFMVGEYETVKQRLIDHYENKYAVEYDIIGWLGCASRVVNNETNEWGDAQVRLRAVLSKRKPL